MANFTANTAYAVDMLEVYLGSSHYPSIFDQSSAKLTWQYPSNFYVDFISLSEDIFLDDTAVLGNVTRIRERFLDMYLYTIEDIHEPLQPLIDLLESGYNSGFLEKVLSGNDVVRGSDHDDSLLSYSGDDIVYGGGGDDYIEGGIGNDVIFGEVGDDSLYGGAGRDIIYGGPGNDVINGGLDADILSGGLGSDLFYGTKLELKEDTIVDFDIFDAIIITDSDEQDLSLEWENGSLTLNGEEFLHLPNYHGRLESRRASNGELLIEGAGTVKGDFNGDGRADILWRNENGSLTNWLGRSDGGFIGNDSKALVVDIPTHLNVAAVADFNGDGRNDILWRGEDGIFTNWLGRSDGGFAGNDEIAFHYVPLDWKVVGTGDFNGDGRADVLWRNQNGSLTNWLGRADGGFVGNDGNAMFYGLSVDLTVAAVADFNGDGRDDILWRSKAGALTNWLGDEYGGFIGNDSAALMDVPTSWNVAGAGDVNGDGRADIIWRNDNGSVTNWLGRSDGGFIGNDAVALINNIPESLKIVALADFNGDGRDDILWRSESGAMTNWLGQATGGFAGNDAAAFNYVPLDWNIQI